MLKAVMFVQRHDGVHTGFSIVLYTSVLLRRNNIGRINLQRVYLLEL